MTNYTSSELLNEVFSVWKISYKSLSVLPLNVIGQDILIQALELQEQ